MAGYRMKKKYNFLNYPLDYQRIIKVEKKKRQPILLVCRLLSE